MKAKTAEKVQAIKTALDMVVLLEDLETSIRATIAEKGRLSYIKLNEVHKTFNQLATDIGFPWRQSLAPVKKSDTDEAKTKASNVALEAICTLRDQIYKANIQLLSLMASQSKRS